jgi:hypothetical protein
MFDRYYYDYDQCQDIRQLWRQARKHSRTEYVWLLHKSVDYSDFDLGFLPDRHQKNYNHAWASHNNPGCYTTWLLPVTDTAETVFHDEILPVLSAPEGVWRWQTNDSVDYDGFEFLWFPDTWDWDKSHGFAMAGTQQLCHTRLNNSQTTGIKYHASDLHFKFIPVLYDTTDIGEVDAEYVWLCDNRIDYTGFDFLWLPDDWHKDNIHAFCMQGTDQLSYTKLVPVKGHTDVVYHHSALRFKPGVKLRMDWQQHPNSFPNYQTAQQLAVHSEWTWITDQRIDYTGWDFDWLPDGWDTRYIHCFSSPEHQQLSYTWLVHPDAFTDFAGYKYHSSDLTLSGKYSDTCCLIVRDSETSFAYDYRTRLVTTMADAIKNAVSKTKSEWLWIKSDCCSYVGFPDDSWLPDLDQISQIHCWPSGDCEKGDTFLIHVPSFDAGNMEFNFNHPSVRRISWPMHHYKQDSLALAIHDNTDRKSVYQLYAPYWSGNFTYPDVCLWEKRPVIGLDASHSCSLVPKDCVVNTEIYEYPYLQKSYVLPAKPIDVIFISNGEPDADVNYQQLLRYHPDAKHSQGITGRLASYKAAADMCETSWFLAVFSKCQMERALDWSPDYWQEPKHYIFHNHNQNTGLTYGHQAPVAYNVNLLKNTTGGLDMTMASKHAVVPIRLSSTYITDEWQSWRTAFREVLKLMIYGEKTNSVEMQHRLHVWQHNATGPEADAQLMGAAFAVNYYIQYREVSDMLLKTAEWDHCWKLYQENYKPTLTVAMTLST